MGLFSKKKREEEEEETGCFFCIYARKDEEGKVFCKKKSKPMSEGENCSSFEYDIFKHRPAAMQKEVHFDPFGGSENE